MRMSLLGISEVFVCSECDVDREFGDETHGRLFLGPSSGKSCRLLHLPFS